MKSRIAGVERENRRGLRRAGPRAAPGRGRQGCDKEPAGYGGLLLGMGVFPVRGEGPNPMSYAFTPVPQPTLPIKGSDRLFPIHRVYCVGRNYAEHTKEMGGDTRDPPFFFQKNPDNVVADGRFPYPPATANVHHELELVVALKSGGANIKAADAM